MKIQATCIAFDNRAYLIKGDSGTGKSSLALALINRGAKLIADDMVEVVNQVAKAPTQKKGWLEVRGIGLVSGNPLCLKAPVRAIIELVQQKPERLPQRQTDSLPVFQIWTEDKNQAEKIVLIDKIITGMVKLE